MSRRPPAWQAKRLLEWTKGVLVQVVPPRAALQRRRRERGRRCRAPGCRGLCPFSMTSAGGAGTDAPPRATRRSWLRRMTWCATCGAGLGQTPRALPPSSRSFISVPAPLPPSAQTRARACNPARAALACAAPSHARAHTHACIDTGLDPFDQCLEMAKQQWEAGGSRTARTRTPLHAHTQAAGKSVCAYVRTHTHTLNDGREIIQLLAKWEKSFAFQNRNPRSISMLMYVCMHACT